MPETKPGGPGPEEKELLPERTSVWIVDDNAEHINSLLRALKYSAGEGFQFTHYQEGEQAIEEFQKLAEEQGLMPTLILMDYKLDDRVENPKYRTGDEVIKALQNLAQETNLTLPEIIGISGDDKFSKKLIEAGAVKAVDKLKIFALFKELAGQK